MDRWRRRAFDVAARMCRFRTGRLRPGILRGRSATPHTLGATTSIHQRRPCRSSSRKCKRHTVPSNVNSWARTEKNPMQPQKIATERAGRRRSTLAPRRLASAKTRQSNRERPAVLDQYHARTTEAHADRVEYGTRSPLVMDAWVDSWVYRRTHPAPEFEPMAKASRKEPSA